jgi:dTDP-4-amino-4,6-dideoxygalactose transaminase
MTEMQAVLLRGGLLRLAAQTALREKRAAQFRKGLEAIGGPLRVAARDPRITRQAYYALTCYFDPTQSGGVNKDAFALALSAEGCNLGGPYWPVYRSPLLNLYDRTSPVPFRDQKKIQDYRHLKLPNTERCVKETAMLLTHSALLGSEAYIDQLLAAIRKVTDQLPVAGKVWAKRQKAQRKK